jgi:Flp pilus assembly protein TadD
VGESLFGSALAHDGGRRITDLDALLREARRASARGDATSSEIAWRRVLEVDPNHPEASYHLGNRARERGEYHAAIEHYERVLRAAPQHAGTLNNLGLAYKAAGEIEPAERCWRTFCSRPSDTER